MGVATLRGVCSKDDAGDGPGNNLPDATLVIDNVVVDVVV